MLTTKVMNVHTGVKFISRTLLLVMENLGATGVNCPYNLPRRPRRK